jgi:hypothetical protein
MHNFNQTNGELPQPLLEALQKLIEAGSSPETISFALGLNLDMVHQLIAKDPKQIARLVESITEKSMEFRCALSRKLMVAPVMTPDESVYEQRILEAHPSLSRARVIPSLKLKAKIVEFSKESLKVLRTYFKLKDLPDILDLTAECLSVLQDDMETVIKFLGSVEGEAIKHLSEKLRDLVSVEYLLSLIRQTARKLPLHALCLVRLVMSEPQSERAFEEAFCCFTEMLNQPNLSPEVLALAEEIAGRLNSSQLGRMNSALGAQPREREIEDKLNELRLKEAYMQLRAGNAEAAVSLVSTMHNSEEVQKFYEEAGLNRGHLSVLKQQLSACLEVVSRESPSVAETLVILHQLFNEELHLLRSEVSGQQSVGSLKAEVVVLHEAVANARNEVRQVQTAHEARLQRVEAQRTEAASVVPRDELLAEEMCIYSYKENTGKLYRTSLVTGLESCYQVPSFSFKQWCCWSQLPDGDLLVTGGGDPCTREVVRIDTRTCAVSPQSPMLTSRCGHAAVYDAQQLYVLGGFTGTKPLSQCERYVCAENRWEAFPPLPTACCGMSGVVLEGSLYAIGGRAHGKDLDVVQRLSLEGLTWEPVHVRLPFAGSCLPCFKLGYTQAYFLLNKTLYSFTPDKLHYVKPVPQGIDSYFGPSYYSRGTLYCSSNRSTAARLEIGSLN